MKLVEDGEKFWGTAKMSQDFPLSIMVDSIKGLSQIYEHCTQTHGLFSAFLMYLPQYEDHVCDPFIGPVLTLANSRELVLVLPRPEEGIA